MFRKRNKADLLNKKCCGRTLNRCSSRKYKCSICGLVYTSKIKRGTIK